MRKKKDKKKPNKYKLVIYNEATLNEKFNINLTKVNVFTYAGLILIFIIVFVIALFIFTPLKNFLPKIQDTGLRTKIETNIIRIDSLQNEIYIRDQYFRNIRNILQGKELDSIEVIIDTTMQNSDEIVFSKLKHDSILKELVANEEEVYLSMISDDGEGSSLKNIHFYKPVQGMISAKFDASIKHYGIDLVAPEDEPILATLGGTVTIATWSVNTGYTIQIQHDNNLISVYKHNSELLKESGDRVEAGEAIAIIGNSGELTTGTHLHFELWYNGTPINPADYLLY